jgi:hypothetical protein
MPAAARQLALPGLALPARPRPARAPRRQRVCVPWRIIASPEYSDVALSVYVKAAALAARPEGCRARVAILAEYLGVSRSTVERGLTDLINPRGGVVELPTVRRTKSCGTGDSAERRPRPLKPGEPYVWLPVAAAETLAPRRLRAYAAIAYATARRIPLAMAELAGLLRHQSGPRAGQPVTERAASQAMDDVEDAGWITIHRRAGERGRHVFEVHDCPLRPAPEPPAGPGADLGEGSGLNHGEGSLATEEDQATTDLNTARSITASAEGATHVSKPAAPVENPRAAQGRAGRALREEATNAPAALRPYRGPTLTYSARVHEALEPVRHLLDGLSPWMQRRIGQEIGRQLDAYASVERLRARLMLRYARTGPAEAGRDPGRWLLGAALPRWGCPDDDCESGVRWSTGIWCERCGELAAARRAGLPPPQPRPPGSAPAWHECADCQAPSRTPLPRGLCAACTPPAHLERSS